VPSARKLVGIAALALAAVAALVYASGTFRGGQTSVTTLMSGWERHFTLEWTVDAPAGDRRRLSGYLTKQTDGHAEPMRLLVQALDAAGAVVERRVWTIPGGVGGGQRAYFEVPDLPPAHEYRVFVWDYSLIQS
jgi:hypothetical protein